MTAETIGRSAAPGDTGRRDLMPGGIAFSGTLHVVVVGLIVIGLPNLFRQPPPQEMPIAVQLVTIAPDTRATQPNPFRPKPEAKPEPPSAAPAPVPERKPEPPPPSPEPPPSAVAPPVPSPPLPAPPPKPEAKTPPPPPPPQSKPEAKAPPPPPKPLEARTPPVPPPPVPERKPRPKPEPPASQHAARAETAPDARAKADPKPESKKADPAAFSKLLRDLENRKEDKQEDEDAFDNLLKNLSRKEAAQVEDAPPSPRRVAALSPPSSQPRAPLGSQLSASEIDLVRDQLRPCFHPPFGAKENPDLVADIRVAMNPDGTVQQARVVDAARYGGDPVYRALADSGVRALRNPRCSPLRLPADRYELWKTFIFGVSTKDMQ